MNIGKIVKSDSHINYVCQIYGPLEVDQQPDPADYAFGRFKCIAIRKEAYVMPTRYKLYLVAQFVGYGYHP